MNKNNYEILAPAGSFEALEAGVKAGCNAVYLGGEKFSARSKAHNFSNEDLKKAVEYAHLRNVKIYVTINILIDDTEMIEAIKFTEYLYKIGVDAIIVQDLGFSLLARKLFKGIEIHASTQMAINNLYGAKTVEAFGFKRVVLARETELSEIELIKEQTDLDIEGFVHGALCVCFSGECLMSSMIGARSGNRGDCAQPCRKKYEILDLAFNKVADEKYLISPKDLNTISSVKQLIDRGIYSLKIEGRMKKPEYVYQIVSSYKKAIEDEVNSEDKNNVKQIFNRGFTNGLFNGDFGRDFISYDRPDNRGVLIGEVISKTKSTYILLLNDKVNIGDGLEFNYNGNSIGLKSDFNSGNLKEYKFKTDKKIIVGSKIYKASSKELLDSINFKLNESASYRIVNIRAEFRIDKKPVIEMECDGFVVREEIDTLVQKAQNRALDEERIRENLSKLGSTIYKAGLINIIFDENIFMPMSAINELRRAAIEKLDRLFIKRDRAGIFVDNSIFNIDRKVKRSKAKLNVEINNLDDLKSLNEKKVNKIYFPIDKITDDVISYLKEKNIMLSAVFKKFQNSKQLVESFDILKNNFHLFDEVLLNNLSQISLLNGIDIVKVADIGLNAFNSYSVKCLLEMGFDRVILSPELNNRQIKVISKNFADKIEVISHGLIPVMTMVHCPMSVELNCKDTKNCMKCKYSRGFYLKDGRGEKFLVERDRETSQIFNCHPIMLAEKVKNYMSMGIENYKLNLREDIDESVNLYSDILNGKSFNSDILKDKLVKKYGAVTNGHYNRGILNGQSV
ncbi:U32 family peptidase [Peptoniphilus mikwangii]|uniref:U32 family peptidase n=1 Tax=Peptoniphilus mikwangii TaxID=1354300 RepID=UPI0003F94177|nr:U32 family peptidase [Peptoniphilus mikwangii]